MAVLKKLLVFLCLASNIFLSESSGLPLAAIRDEARSFFRPNLTELYPAQVESNSQFHSCPCFQKASHKNSAADRLVSNPHYYSRTVVYIYKDLDSQRIFLYSPKVSEQKLFPELNFDPSDYSVEPYAGTELYNFGYNVPNGIVVFRGDEANPSYIPQRNNYDLNLNLRPNYNLHIPTEEYIQNRVDSHKPVDVNDVIWNSGNIYKKPFSNIQGIKFPFVPNSYISVENQKPCKHCSNSQMQIIDSSQYPRYNNLLRPVNTEQEIVLPYQPTQESINGQLPFATWEQGENVPFHHLPIKKQLITAFPETQEQQYFFGPNRPADNLLHLKELPYAPWHKRIGKTPIAQTGYEIFTQNFRPGHPHYDTTFDSWFQQQLKNVDLKRQPFASDIDFTNLKLIIQNTLRDNGIIVNADGFLTDSAGHAIDTHSLFIRTILIGNTVPYHKVVRGKTMNLLKNEPYLEVLMISIATNPPKTLGLIPLGLTYIPSSNKENQHIYITRPQSISYSTQSNIFSPLVQRPGSQTQIFGQKGLGSSMRRVSGPGIVGQIRRKIHFPFRNRHYADFWPRYQQRDADTSEAIELGEHTRQAISDEQQKLGQTEADMATPTPPTPTEPQKEVKYRIIGGSSASNSGPLVNVKGRSGQQE